MSVADYIEARVERVPLSGCWIWMGALTRYGYPRMPVRFANGRRSNGQRIAYEVFVGPVPADLHVLHRCDIPACVNPAHLFVGDDAANHIDKANKGRALKKLKPGDAAEIRRANGSCRAIGSRFGISATMVSMIKRGKQGRFV